MTAGGACTGVGPGSDEGGGQPPGGHIVFDLPSNIRFDSASHPGTLRVSYVNLPAGPKDEAAVLKDPLDLWGAAWALNRQEAPGVVDVRPPRALSRARLRTLVLRMDALQECLEGIEFRLDGTTRFRQEADEIRRDIRSGLLFTFDRTNLHRGARSAKPAAPAGVQAHVVQHGKKFLQGALPHRFLLQFPAQVFKTSLADQNRATTRFWIDLLGADKEGRLSVILTDAPGPVSLDVFAEGLDGAIFCREFRSHVARNWLPEVTSERIAMYLVSDRFHPALQANGDAPQALTRRLRASDWLDVILVQVDSAGLPQNLSERIVFPVPVPPIDGVA